MTILITCGETRQSLAAARSMGRRNIAVSICAKQRPSLAMWSRYVTSAFLSLDPNASAYEFAEQIGFELKARYALVSLVSSDSAFWAVSKYRDLLPSNASKIFPPHYSVVRSLDTEALYHFAKSLNIRCAPLMRVEPESEFEEAKKLSHSLKFPALVRPIIPWTKRNHGAQSLLKKRVINNKSEFEELIKKPNVLENGILLSSYKTLRAISYFGVAHKGEVIAEGFQERLNEQESFNEVATLAITIEPIARIREISKTLLSALNWQGPFKIEYVKDKSKNYQMVSLIGRLWASMQLAISAGVDIPYICYRMAQGNLSKDILKNARPNVKMRWLIGDLSSKFFNMQKFIKNTWYVTQSLGPWNLLKKNSGKKKVITCYDVYDLKDPMPFLFELQHKTWKQAFKGRL